MVVLHQKSRLDDENGPRLLSHTSMSFVLHLLSSLTAVVNEVAHGDKCGYHEESTIIIYSVRRLLLPQIGS